MKKKKLTPEQREKHQKALAQFNSEFEAAEGNEAIDLQSGKQAPDRVWACTPEMKLKASTPQFDLELSPEMARGGLLRIIRIGSNRIKICSMVETKYLGDGVGEAKKQAKDKKDAALQKAVKKLKPKK